MFVLVIWPRLALLAPRFLELASLLERIGPGVCTAHLFVKKEKEEKEQCGRRLLDNSLFSFEFHIFGLRSVGLRVLVLPMEQGKSRTPIKALNAAHDMRGAIEQTDARVEDLRLRLNAVKISEYVEAQERPELNGFLYPEVPAVEAAVEAVKAAVAEAEQKRRKLPVGDDSSEADITPNMVVKYMRAADSAMAALRKAEVAVEEELASRHQRETEPSRHGGSEPAEDEGGAGAGAGGGGGAGGSGGDYDDDEDFEVDEDPTAEEETKSVTEQRLSAKEEALARVAEEEAAGRTLWDAVRAGTTELVKAYLTAWTAERVVVMHDKALDEGSRTALHSAAWRGHLATAELLLGAGAKPNAIDLTSSRTTALMEAARGGHAVVCRALILHKASAGLADVQGSTALHWAARRGHGTVVHTIVQAVKDAARAHRARLAEARLAKAHGHAGGHSHSHSHSHYNHHHHHRPPTGASHSTSTSHHLHHHGPGGGGGGHGPDGGQGAASSPKELEAVISLLSRKNAKGKTPMDIATNSVVKNAFQSELQAASAALRAMQDHQAAVKAEKEGKEAEKEGKPVAKKKRKKKKKASAKAEQE